MKYIKNVSGGTLTIEGQDILDSTYYGIKSTEESKYASSSYLLTLIASSSAVMAKSNDGLNDITDVNLAVDFLKGLLPTSM